MAYIKQHWRSITCSSNLWLLQHQLILYWIEAGRFWAIARVFSIAATHSHRLSVHLPNTLMSLKFSRCRCYGQLRLYHSLLILLLHQGLRHFQVILRVSIVIIQNWLLFVAVCQVLNKRLMEIAWVLLVLTSQILTFIKRERLNCSLALILDKALRVWTLIIKLDMLGIQMDGLSVWYGACRLVQLIHSTLNQASSLHVHSTGSWQHPSTVVII